MIKISGFFIIDKSMQLSLVIYEKSKKVYMAMLQFHIFVTKNDRFCH